MGATLMEEQETRKIMAVLSNKNYLLLWLGQLVSSIGSSFNSISLYFLLLQTATSQGFLPLFGLFLVNALVYLLFAPVTGALVDSWNRRKTMIAADLLRVILVLCIPLANSLWQIYLLSALISLATLFFDPARNSLLPRVLESRKELLFLGNSFMTTSVSIAETIGFLAGGVFVVTYGFAAAFYLHAATFLISALCIFRLKVAEPAWESVKVGQVVSGFIAKVRGGLQLVWSLGKLRSFFSFYFLFALAFGAGNFLFPILVEEGYQLGADAFGYFSGSMTLGYLVGSFLLGPVGDRFDQFRLLTGAVLVIGLSTILLGAVSSFTWALLAAFLIGLLNPVTAVFSRVFVQEEVAEEHLGRVFSLLSLVMQVGMLASLALAFGLLQLLAVRQVMLVLGGLTVLAAVVGPKLTRLAQYVGAGTNAGSTENVISG